MNKNKKIIVFAGPSGVGKSTLCNMLLNNFNQFKFSVSATTRPIRLDEKNGKDYYFFSNEEFKGHIDGEGFIEWEEVYPNIFYGTLRSEVEKIMNEGKKAVFDIDVLGAINIKKIYGEKAHIIFVKTESPEALEKRLRERHSETEEELQVRIARFQKELGFEDQFDETIINKTGDLESSKRQIVDIVNKYFI